MGAQMWVTVSVAAIAVPLLIVALYFGVRLDTPGANDLVRASGSRKAEPAANRTSGVQRRLRRNSQSLEVGAVD